MKVSLCSAQTNYDTQLSVFTGSCFGLLCVDGNDDGADEGCGLSSSLEFTTTAFEVYRIAVSYGRSIDHAKETINHSF